VARRYGSRQTPSTSRVASLPLSVCVLIFLCPELQYIRILEAELFRRADILSTQEPPKEPEKVEEPLPPIPREKPPRPVEPLINYVLPGFKVD